MNGRANYFKIGLFVIAGTVIAVAAVIILGVGAVFQEEILVESYFADSVQGLEVGSPVNFRGVQIGKVDKIGLVNQEYATGRRYVLIRMAIFSDVFLVEKADDTGGGLDRLIRDGLRVRLNFQGVTGTAYIEADYLDPVRYPSLEFEWTPKYPYIPSAPSIITRLTDMLDEFRVSFEDLSTSIQKSLDIVIGVLEETNVPRIGEEAGKLLREMQVTNGEIKKLVQEIDAETLTSEAVGTLRETRKLVNETRPLLHELLRTALQAAETVNRLATWRNQGIFPPLWQGCNAPPDAWTISWRGSKSRSKPSLTISGSYRRTFGKSPRNWRKIPANSSLADLRRELRSEVNDELAATGLHSFALLLGDAVFGLHRSFQGLFTEGLLSCKRFTRQRGAACRYDVWNPSNRETPGLSPLRCEGTGIPNPGKRL